MEGVMIGEGHSDVGWIQSLCGLLKGCSERGIRLGKSHEEDHSMKFLVSIFKREFGWPGVLELLHGSGNPSSELKKRLTLSKLDAGESLVGLELLETEECAEAHEQ
jgi:hypothetical protein